MRRMNRQGAKIAKREEEKKKPGFLSSLLCLGVLGVLAVHLSVD
jgi:hypothetical protein